MKKISLLIFTLVSLFVFTGNVFALTCSYNNSSDVLNSEKVSATYDFNSSGEVTYTDGVKINKDQLKEIQSQIASTGTCPLYAFYGKDKQMHLYYDREQMSNDNLTMGKFSVPCINDPQEYKEGKELLNQVSVNCNGIAATKFDYKTCWDEDKVATKYTECQAKASALRSTLNTDLNQVRGYAESGFIDKTSKEYNDMEKVCAAADKNLKDYEEALKYKSCKEFNEATGGTIECSVTDDKVEDNPYVKKKDDGESDAVDSKDSCGGVFGSINNKENFAYYLFHAFQIIKFLGPILVVVMSILDLVKITADPKQDDQLQKLGFKTLKRLVYAALIFILPDLINYLFGLVGLYGTCGIY